MPRRAACGESRGTRACCADVNVRNESATPLHPDPPPARYTGDTEALPSEDPMSRGSRATPALVAFVLTVPAAAPAGAATGSNSGGHYNFRRS